MKNIYDDSTNRTFGGREERQGDFTQSYVPPSIKSVHSKMKRVKKESFPRYAEEVITTPEPQYEPGYEPQFEPQIEPQVKLQQPPQALGNLQLTNEQIASLLNQYISIQQNVGVEHPPVSPTQQASNPNVNGSDTQIIFQSPDFNQNDSGAGARVRESYYDDYDEDEDEYDSYDFPSPADNAFSPERGLFQQAAPTPIDEINISSPSKPPIKTVSQKAVQSPRTKQIKPVEIPKSERRMTFRERMEYVEPVETENLSKREVKGEVKREEKPVVRQSVPTATAETGKKKASTSDKIRRIVLCVSILAIVVAGAYLIREYKLHIDNKKFEENVSDLVIVIDEPTEKKPTKKPKKDKDKNKDKETTTEEVKLTPEQRWAQIKAEYPNTKFPEKMQLKYARLYATNNEFVGYLEAKGVNLSLPVVQTDNDDTYLNRNFYGASTKYGCPFVTHTNNIKELDMNTVIFGHHMNDGTIFGALDAYKSIDGFKKAPLITFNTLYSNYKWKVIAAFITNAYPKDDNGFVFRYYFTTLSTEERFAAYQNELAQRTLYHTGVDVLPTDKLLALSTCSHEFDEARFVVVARLVRPGESEVVDTSLATVNSNPRYPQTYYTKKRLTNPYANATRWEVG